MCVWCVTSYQTSQQLADNTLENYYYIFKLPNISNSTKQPPVDAPNTAYIATDYCMGRRKKPSKEPAIRNTFVQVAGANRLEHIRIFPITNGQWNQSAELGRSIVIFTSTDESVTAETFCRPRPYTASVTRRRSLEYSTCSVSNLSLCLWTITSDNCHKAVDSDFMQFCQYFVFLEHVGFNFGIVC